MKNNRIDGFSLTSTESHGFLGLKKRQLIETLELVDPESVDLDLYKSNVNGWDRYILWFNRQGEGYQDSFDASDYTKEDYIYPCTVLTGMTEDYKWSYFVGKLFQVYKRQLKNPTPWGRAFIGLFKSYKKEYK